MSDDASASPPSQRRGVEDLVLTHMLRRLDNARPPVDEATVKATLMPMYVPPLDTAADREGFLAAVLRTGTAFVLSADDAPGFGADLMDVTWEPWDGLPPLPFPRIWIETAPSAEGVPSFPEDGGNSTPSGLFGIAIVGDESEWVVAELYDGTEFDVRSVTEPWQPDGVIDIQVERVSADATTHYPFPVDPDEMDPDPISEPVVKAMQAWRAISAVQIIDVLGSRQVPLAVPRPHRRAHERKFNVAHPQVYFVDLRQAGEPKAGSGDREYHHRWLVRGHWRHLNDGRRTWVRPYVKGPAGAPWRGRPVYRDGAQEDNTGATRGQQDVPRQPETRGAG